ncbi:MAG TPA: hypothetical protein VFZ66_11080 [Herpetosiphonaceae bacterium]
MALDRDTSDRERSEQSGKTPSTAPNASWDTGAGDGTTGFDSPATGSEWLSNPEVDGDTHSEPYYPPGGGADNDPDLHDERKG